MTSPTYVRRADVLFTTVAGEVLALDVERGHCFGMNEVASEVWALLEQPRTLEDICRELTGQFDVDAARCEEEIATLLEQFRSDGLVQIQRGS